jgi:ABC-2 type transport system permease protein
MTSQTTTASLASEQAVRQRPATFADALRSEWTKFRSLRSTWATVLGTVVLGLGLGMLISSGMGESFHAMPPEEQAAFDPTNGSLTGLIVAQLAIGVLGVLVATSEYATGMIRTSLAAVPRRGRLLAAKAGVFTPAALIVGQAVAFGAFAVGQPVLAGEDAPHAALSDPEVLRAVTGAGLYLTLIGLVGVALGVLVRVTAAAISILVGGALIVPAFAGALPDVVQKFWPTLAGGRIMAVTPNPDALGPWAGFGVLAASVALLLAAAYAVFRLRDA